MDKNNNNNIATLEVAHVTAMETTIVKGVLTVFLNFTDKMECVTGMDTLKSLNDLASYLCLMAHDDIKPKFCEPDDVEHSVQLLHMTAAKKDAKIALVSATAGEGDLLELSTVYYKQADFS